MKISVFVNLEKANDMVDQDAPWMENKSKCCVRVGKQKACTVSGKGSFKTRVTYAPLFI